jgi:hypothetical protein
VNEDKIEIEHCEQKYEVIQKEMSKLREGKELSDKNVEELKEKLRDKIREM